MFSMIRCQKFDYFPHFSKNKRLTDTVGNIQNYYVPDLFSNSSSKAKEYVIYSLECCHIFHSSSQLWNVIYLLHVFFLLITSSQYSLVDRKLPISGPKLVWQKSMSKICSQTSSIWGGGVIFRHFDVRLWDVFILKYVKIHLAYHCSDINKVIHRPAFEKFLTSKI